ESVSCQDASVILRGQVTADDPKAGPARESAILRSCTDDKWPAAILACVGSDKKPRDCLGKLTEQQTDNLQAKLELWTSQYGTDSGYGGDPSTEGEQYVDCSQLVDDVTRYAPPFDVERDWQVTARKRLIENTCNTEGWTEETKTCLVGAKDIAGATVCLQPEPSAPKLTQQLVDLDGVAGKIAAAKKKPASIACAKVVATHYADPRWKDRLKTAKDRKQQITASRAEMLKVCTAEAWSETQRACIIVNDEPRCYESSQRWGYPALVGAKVAGMPDDCATYQAAMDRIIACDALPQASRDAMKDAFSEATKMWTNLSADDAKQIAPICKQGVDAMLNAFPQCGGW
ncbi:MAG: hypothetical protein ABI591_12740, partial [Kofleriaceae bacterium]